MRKSAIILVVFLTLVLVSMPVQAQEEYEWSVIIDPPLVAIPVNESMFINITIAGEPNGIFILTVQNETLVNVFIHSYILDYNGSLVVRYNVTAFGTFFVNVGDGEVNFLSAPSTFIVVLDEGEIEIPHDEIQDRMIEQLIREGNRKTALLEKMREWVYISLLACLIIIAILTEIIIYYKRHIIHEHTEYWNQGVVTGPLRKTTTHHVKNPKPEDRTKGFWRKFELMLGLQPPEYEGFVLQSPEDYDRIAMHDLKEIHDGVQKKKRFFRVMKKGFPRKYECIKCGAIFEIYGSETVCPICQEKPDIGD